VEAARLMRKRRPAPLGDKGASVVPLSRAHRVRGDADETGTAGATALELRDATRSRFGELSPSATTALSPDATRQQRPGGPRVPARARRANAAHEAHDGWTFMFIPPGADARPRTLRVSVRRLRFIVASFAVIFGSTALTGGLLVLALSVLPPAQDEVRGVELGVFAPGALAFPPDGARTDTAITPAGLAAASAGAAAPRATARAPRRAAERPRPAGTVVNPSIIESLPVVGEITSRFARARRHPLLGVVRKHAGIDIAAPAGTHITAPAAGRVTFSGKKFGYGYTVEIDHGDGIITRYAHCRSLMVRAGDEVADGAVIATVGRSGLATAPHLHYEILVRGRSIDPLRTSLTSLLVGERPPPTSAPPQPTDSALRDPDIPDAILIPDVPDVPEVPDGPFSSGDAIIISPPVISNTSSSVTALPPNAIVSPPVALRDTTRKS
jgi:murein DD-endopeptidase MepM/ murein hydrolase activator NlpD